MKAQLFLLWALGKKMIFSIFNKVLYHLLKVVFLELYLQFGLKYPYFFSTLYLYHLLYKQCFMVWLCKRCWALCRFFLTYYKWIIYCVISEEHEIAWQFNGHRYLFVSTCHFSKGYLFYTFVLSVMVLLLNFLWFFI